MHTIAKLPLRAVAIAGIAATIAAAAHLSPASGAGARAESAAPATQMYIIDDFRFYVHRPHRPGTLSVDLGVQNAPGISLSAVIIAAQGDLPPMDGFHRAAERYLRSYVGDCAITDYESQSDAEIRYTYACR